MPSNVPGELVKLPFNCGFWSSSFFELAPRPGGSACPAGAGRGCGSGPSAAGMRLSARHWDRLSDVDRMSRRTNICSRKGVVTGAAPEPWHIGLSCRICRQVTDRHRWKLSVNRQHVDYALQRWLDRTIRKDMASERKSPKPLHAFSLTPITRAQNHETMNVRP